jgi:hypothetical protein
MMDNVQKHNFIYIYYSKYLSSNPSHILINLISSLCILIQF